MVGMIVLYTDFGLSGPYVGQLHAVLAQQAPGIPVIDLFHDVPNHDVRAGAYLLPAYAQEFPPGTIFVCVVDPGVGMTRPAVLLRADGRLYVGPGNGILNVAAIRARTSQWHEIRWRPARLSASFHGRDLFAPVAAMLARGQEPEIQEWAPEIPSTAWPEDLSEVLYVDRFGNLITGIRAAGIAQTAQVGIRGTVLPYARTFGDTGPGRLFWYENSSGLIEIAANQDRADRQLGCVPGDVIEILLP